MTKEKLPKGYLYWINAEKEAAEEAYASYKAQGRRQMAKVGLKDNVVRIKAFNNSSFLRVAAAAVLVLALGTSIWIFRDTIFKPKYTEEQIDLAYQHAVKSLAVCSNSISDEISKLQKLNEITKSLDNINKLENVINN